MPHEGIQLDLQKQVMSGVNSPAAVPSPTCEVRNELVFPSLPTVQPQPQLQQQQSLQEPPKVTPKISQLSELDQQLSKLHNQRPVLSQTQGQQSMSQTYSEAVRQSPTTVQQQFTQPNATQQVQAPSQNTGQPLNLVQNIQAANQVQSPVPLQSQLSIGGGDSARKLSRFVISKVSEEPKPQPQSQQQQQQLNQQSQPMQQQANQVPPQSLPKSTNNSPENEQIQLQQQQNVVQSPNNVQPMIPSQGNQAQMFFQQHHGGVVSKHFLIDPLPPSMSFTKRQRGT